LGLKSVILGIVGRKVQERENNLRKLEIDFIFMMMMINIIFILIIYHHHSPLGINISDIIRQLAPV
jgi:hypothetical protein